MPARASNGRGAESAACARAIADARRRAADLTRKRIPQYVALGAASDAGHFKAILQKQQALRHALKRIALSILPCAATGVRGMGADRKPAAQTAPSSAAGLPACLLRHRDIEMTKRQAKALAARFDHIEEIAQAMQGAAAGSLPQTLSDLELDSAVVQSIPNDPEEQISPWLAHDSFTFGMPGRELAAQLPRELAARLAEGGPGVAASDAEVARWLGEIGEVLHRLLDGFRRAERPVAAMAHWLAIDAILANVHALTIRRRFANP